MSLTDIAQINIDEIQRDLLSLLQRVEAGETLIILKGGKPMAEIKPITAKTTRPFGLCIGEFTVPDDFDSPLPEHVLQGFEGS